MTKCDYSANSKSDKVCDNDIAMKRRVTLLKIVKLAETHGHIKGNMIRKIPIETKDAREDYFKLNFQKKISKKEKLSQKTLNERNKRLKNLESKFYLIWLKGYY